MWKNNRMETYKRKSSHFQKLMQAKLLALFQKSAKYLLFSFVLLFYNKFTIKEVVIIIQILAKYILWC